MQQWGSPPRRVSIQYDSQVHDMTENAFSHHAPIWWGNLFVLIIEGAAFAILIVTYFYIWHNFDSWPPSRTLLPDLRIPSINLLLLLISIAPFWYAARFANLDKKASVVGLWLIFGALFGIAAIVLRGFEFRALHTRFNSNAYGSITWTILGVHLAHLLAGTIGTFLIGLAMVVGPVEKKHYTDASAVVVYWYFIVISWVVLYAIVFLVPRFA